MIDRYLERGELFVMHDTQETETVAVAVVTNEGNGVYELKNLAVAPACQRKGYGRQMVEYLCRHYADVCHTLLVGTGESKQTIALKLWFQLLAYRRRLFHSQLRPPDRRGRQGSEGYDLF